MLHVNFSYFEGVERKQASVELVACENIDDFIDVIIHVP